MDNERKHDVGMSWYPDGTTFRWDSEGVHILTDESWNRTEVLEAISLIMNNIDRVVLRDDLEEIAKLFATFAYSDVPEVFDKFWIFTELLHAEIGKKIRNGGLPK